MLNSCCDFCSYINTKSEDERRTPEFVAEIYRSLYFIHEHNSEVYKVGILEQYFYLQLIRCDTRPIIEIWYY